MSKGERERERGIYMYVCIVTDIIYTLQAEERDVLFAAWSSAYHLLLLVPHCGRTHRRQRKDRFHLRYVQLYGWTVDKCRCPPYGGF